MTLDSAQPGDRILVARTVAAGPPPPIPDGWDLVGLIPADRGVDYRARRNAVGIGIRELERRTGISRGRLSEIERGMPPTDAEIESIDAALAEPAVR